MSNIDHDIHAAMSKVATKWDDEHALQLEGQLIRRHRRRVLVRGAIAPMSVLVVVFIGSALFLRLRSSAPAPVVVTASDGVIHLDDGSTITPRGSSSVIRFIGASGDAAIVELSSGGAAFAALAPTGRSFGVQAGATSISIRGSKFGVERIADRIRVFVDSGEASVVWNGQATALRAGATAMYPRDEPAAPAIVAAPAHLERPGPPSRSKRQDRNWKELAENGDYDEAYAALTDAQPPTVRDEPGELLLSADVKRLSHHPAEAVAPLRKILSDHGQDARAPLAAFTLGRVLLDELGNPLEAAEAFRRAESMAPNGALAQDAVAREVEAWSRGGDSQRARTRAEDYVRRFPSGRRLNSVRRFGGIE